MSMCQRRCDMQMCFVDSSVVCVDEYSQGMTSSQTNPITLYPPAVIIEAFRVGQADGRSFVHLFFCGGPCVDSDVSTQNNKD